MLKRGLIGTLCVSVVLTFGATSVFAQPGSVTIEHAAPVSNPVKSLEQFQEIYGISPDSVYTEYVKMLLDQKKYPQAEKVIQHQISLHPQDQMLHLDLGTVYAKQRKDILARDQFDMVLKLVNGDDMLTQRLAKAFLDAGNIDYAIMVYEKATKLINVPYYYSGPLAKLYAQCGEIGKAIDVILIPIPGMGVNTENVKTILLELLGNDPAKLQLMQRALINRINEDAGNTFYADLLTWVYIQKDDWDGALMQMIAIDERNQAGGRYIMELSRSAANAKQYSIAIKGFDEIIDKGKSEPYYMLARSEKLKVGLMQIQNNHAYTAEDVSNLRILYDSFLTEFPKYYTQQTASDYALLEAQYDNNVKKAIEILKKAIAEPDTRRAMAGKFRLQLGNYYVLAGRLWDASLTYSQVDKEFKQDADGEDARFRNAKLAYYRGDFDWAQRQLSRLKSATSELIANDAIYLSVLITENVQDSDIVPLQRFAYAGLLEFQNKDKEVEILLDSLNKAFPKHPLNDDILMMRANIALKHHDYNKAIEYLKTVYEQFGQDVLGDDAVYSIAAIYQEELHDIEKAKHYYEQLIIDYPGSTFVQAARQKLNEINNPIVP